MRYFVSVYLLLAVIIQLETKCSIAVALAWPVLAYKAAVSEPVPPAQLKDGGP